MSVYLLDINLLVALLWTNHEQHELASEWFHKHHKSGWATCPLTQAGFVRVSSNPRIFADAPPPAKALEILSSNLNHPSHRFFKDEISFPNAVKPFSDRFSGHQQTTDAYLFGLAISKRSVFATFDKSIAALAGADAALQKSLEILH